MKRMILIVVGIGVLGGAVFYLNRQKTPPAVAAPSTPQTATERPAPTETKVAVVEPPREVPAAVSSTPIQPTAAVATEPKPADAQAAAVARIVDTLVSGQTDLKQKQATWRQLREAGQLDLAIADLKQRAAANPNAAEYPTALGEAYVAKIPAATDPNTRGILALQADQSFDDALRLAPDSWEAQFVKVASLSHWPEGLGKGDEVIQRLTTLINQQESQPVRPEFAQSYLLLGNQYQKAGNLEYARGVWQAGATLFPGNAELKGKLAGTQ